MNQPLLNCYNMVTVNGKPEYKLVESFPCSTLRDATAKAEKYIWDMRYYDMIQVISSDSSVYAEYEN